MELDLFGDDNGQTSTEAIGDRASLLRGLALADANDLIDAVDKIAAVAPFRQMATPGGLRMSVGITACGEVGWVSDGRGYRYARLDPETGLSWPPMPALFRQVAARAAAQAGFDGFAPDACLINCYAPGARMSLHQDRNERSYDEPIVSISLGLPAVFLFGGMQRSDRPSRHRLEHGDVVVWGGPSRLAFHGVAPLKDGDHPLLGPRRINLTFRKAL